MRHVRLFMLLAALACDPQPPQPETTTTTGTTAPATTSGAETATSCGTSCDPQADPCKAAGGPCDPANPSCPEGLTCVAIAGHSPDFGYCVVRCSETDPCAHGTCWPDGVCRNEKADFMPPAGCPAPSPLVPRNAYWLPGCQYDDNIVWNDDHKNKPHNCAQKLALCVDGAVQHCDVDALACWKLVQHCVTAEHTSGKCWKSTEAL